MEKIKALFFVVTLKLFCASMIIAKTPHAPTSTPLPPSKSFPQTTAVIPVIPTTNESFSLMLSDDEQKALSNTANNRKNTMEEALICHYLGGIVYSTPTNWTLWLNDQIYSYGSDIPGITILEVTNNKVRLKAKDSKSKSGSWLDMGKTFCCDTGQTLSGDQRR